MQPYDREDREAQSIGSRESVYLLINALTQILSPNYVRGYVFFLKGSLVLKPIGAMVNYIYKRCDIIFGTSPSFVS